MIWLAIVFLPSLVAVVAAGSCCHTPSADERLMLRKGQKS